MFGEFSLRYGEVVIGEGDFRSKKVCRLIEVLIMNRNQRISTDKLIEAIYENEECQNPLNVLKNLVWRARTLLRELIGAFNEDYIVRDQYTYMWNGKIQCVLDTDEFEKYAALAENEVASEKSLELYFHAVSLYKGEFLSKAPFDNWLQYKRIYLSNIYMKCVRGISEVYMIDMKYDSVISLCEAALLLYPYEENIHEILLSAYSEAGRINKAIMHYNNILKIFMNDLGVELSPPIKALYRKIVDKTNSTEQDIAIIENDLIESSQLKTAFFCNYEVFKNIYRLVARMYERTEHPFYISLITVTDADSAALAESQLRDTMTALQEAIIETIRRSDVVARYSKSQFVIMHSTRAIDDGNIIFNRINTKFKSLCPNKEILLTNKLSHIKTAP